MSLSDDPAWKALQALPITSGKERAMDGSYDWLPEHLCLAVSGIEYQKLAAQASKQARILAIDGGCSHCRREASAMQEYARGLYQDARDCLGIE